jgi:hypothetical protein
MEPRIETGGRTQRRRCAGLLRRVSDRTRTGEHLDDNLVPNTKRALAPTRGCRTKPCCLASLRLGSSGCWAGPVRLGGAPPPPVRSLELVHEGEEVAVLICGAVFSNSSGTPNRGTELLTLRSRHVLLIEGISPKAQEVSPMGFELHKGNVPRAARAHGVLNGGRRTPPETVRRCVDDLPGLSKTARTARGGSRRGESHSLATHP